MSNDDYDVIVFRILTYLYACFKRKIIFDYLEFDCAIKANEMNERIFKRCTTYDGGGWSCK